MNKTLDFVRNTIVEKKRNDFPLIVGINGIDTSGKTYLSKIIEKELKLLGYTVQVIHVDDFHNPIPIRFSGKDQIDDYYNFSFDFKKLVDEVLEPIKSKHKLSKTITHLNLATDKFEIEKRYKVSTDTIVILEGVFIFKDEIRKYLDYNIFIQISEREMNKRAFERDANVIGNEESVMFDYKNKYFPTQQKYLKLFPPEVYAHMIINNNDWNNPEIIK